VPRKYYARVVWLQVPAPTVPGKPPGALFPCYVQGACWNLSDILLVRKKLGEVVARKAKEQMSRLTIAGDSGAAQVDEYASELFEELIRELGDVELRVETPATVYEYLPGDNE